MEEEIQKLEEHEEQYKIFQDDSRIVVDEGDLEPIERLLQHKYDKYKFVSQDFLKRNHLKRSSNSSSKKSKVAMMDVVKPAPRSSKRRATVSVQMRSSPPSRTKQTSREIETSAAKATKSLNRASDILEKLAEVKVSRSEIRDKISPARAESILKRISESQSRVSSSSDTKKKRSDRNE